MRSGGSAPRAATTQATRATKIARRGTSLLKNSSRTSCPSWFNAFSIHDCPFTLRQRQLCVACNARARRLQGLRERMASYRKNVAVGVTMIGALTALAIMILLFGEAPVRLFKTAQLNVKFTADSAEGVSNGSPIFYLGVNVG